MKASKMGFSFIELIVGISISMILMISVGVLVSSGMKNITIQKQILDGNNSMQNIGGDLNELLSGQFELISNTPNSMILKSLSSAGKPLYHEVTISSQTGYCANDPDLATSRLKITSFNPFDLTKAPGRTGSYLKHQIYSLTPYIGKGIFGSELKEGSPGTSVYLNTPSGITSNAAKLIVSDYGNNRVIYASGAGFVYTLLNEKQGILGPTGLYYSAPGTLFILNSGKKELLSMTSPNSATSGPIDIVFHPKSNTSVDQMVIDFLPNTGFSINGSYSRTDLIFGGVISVPPDTLNTTATRLTYTFNTPRTLSPNDTLSIPSFSGSMSSIGNYYMKVIFYNSGTPVHTEYYPYASKSDGNLYTIEDNVITVLSGALAYDYTVISPSGGNIVLQDFMNRKETTLTKTGQYISTNNLPIFDISTAEQEVKLSDFTIKDFGVKKTGNLLHLKIDYYKTFSCFNEKDSIIKTLLLKKVIP